MAFLSYAQNFEDVMLWRALGHVPNGFYVDVGAQHPRIDSVSRAFYEHGWRGVHVEPVPEFARLLCADRPDETVLQAALGEAPGVLELNVFADTGLSTAVAAFAERHIAERDYEVERIEVPMMTLATAMAPLAGREVHWLKIDVEGFEEQVLRGWDSQALRPWVLVVEATLPNLPDTDYAGWDPIILGANYTFVYFDGLNRFYVAAEHPELVAAFAVPPNVFDAVELSGLASWGLARPILEQRDALTRQFAATAQQLQQSQDAHEHTAELLRQATLRTAELLRQATLRTAELQARLDAERHDAHLAARELHQQVNHWWRSADALTKQLDSIYASRSWRAAAPLRALTGLARRARVLAGQVKRRVAGRAAPVDAEAAAVEGLLAAPGRKLSPHAESVYADLKQVVNETR